MRSASASTVATKSSSSGGILSWLTGGSSSASTPLEYPLSGLDLPPPLPDYVEPGKTKISTLPNGVKIASETSTVCRLSSFSSCIFVLCNVSIRRARPCSTLFDKVVFACCGYQNPAASVGLYVDCGSIYENPISSGATHLLERMAFKTTKNRSHLRVVREVEAIGGNVQASASREHMGYNYDALKTYVPEMVELLIDSVRNPAFLDWEVNEQVCFITSLL